MKEYQPPETPPQRPHPSALRQSRARAAAHAEWTEAHRDADLPYRPTAEERQTPSDYGYHRLEMEATPEMLDDLERRYRKHLRRLEAEDG